MRALLLALAVLVTSTTPVLARKPDVRTRITGQLDKALKVIKAPKDQRAQVQRAMADVLRIADDLFGGPNGMMPELEEILAVFAAERVDDKAVESIKTRRNARHHRMGDALEKAFIEVHAILSAEQRRKIADHGRGQVTGAHMRAFKEKIIDGFVGAAVEDVLDQLAASQAERNAAHVARDQVLGAIKAARSSRPASAEELAALFTADAVDKDALAKFRAAREDQLRVLGDQFATVIIELHAALTPAHRKQIVELVRARQARREATSTSDTPL